MIYLKKSSTPPNTPLTIYHNDILMIGSMVHIMSFQPILYFSPVDFDGTFGGFEDNS